MLPVKFAMESMYAWENAIDDRSGVMNGIHQRERWAHRGRMYWEGKGQSSELMLLLGPGSVTGWRKHVISVRNLCGECISHCLNFYKSHNNWCLLNQKIILFFLPPFLSFPSFPIEQIIWSFILESVWTKSSLSLGFLETFLSWEMEKWWCVETEML